VKQISTDLYHLTYIYYLGKQASYEFEPNNDEFNLVAEDSKEENELKHFEENGSKASEENDLKPKVIY
jgi:hypothetical protein